MGDDAVLTFQAPSDARLLQAIVQRGLRPVKLWTMGALFLVAVVCAVFGARSYAIVLAAVSGIMLPISFHRMAAAAMKRSEVVSKTGTMVTYRIDSAGIHTASAFESHVFPWSDITAVKQCRGQIAVHFGRLKLLGIPTGTLTAQQAEQLLRILRSRGDIFSNASGSP